MTEKFATHVENLLQSYDRQIPSVTHMLCDRHDPSKVALYYENESGKKQHYTYGDLSHLAAQFANVLREHDVEKGDRIAVLLPKGPELLISILAIWRLGAIQVPLFTAFGPQAISYRIHNSGSHVVVTDIANRSKLDEINMEYSDEATTGMKIITAESDKNRLEHSDTPFWETLQNAEPIAENAEVNGDDLFILLYTSGTTGQPKGVEVPVNALAAFESYMHFGLDLQKDDVFWNIADPGWAYGLYFGVVGPMLLGQSFIMYDAKFNVLETVRILQEYNVTNFTAAPTVYKTIRAEGIPDAIKNNLALRHLSSAGEPLNPELSDWAETHLHLPIYDHYGQTELGMIINNHHHPSFHGAQKEGSMGQSMPGFRGVILDTDANELSPGYDGLLAIDTTHSPLFWFPGYYQDEKRTGDQFSRGRRYYLTGDTCRQDEDGYFYFSGRSDDIITSAGYKISPFEVESALMTHKDIAEAAVVGVPDEKRGEIVKAFIVLRSGLSPNDERKTKISQFVKHNLSAHEYPRAIDFVHELPKTSSGKIQRFQLRHH